MPEVKSIENFPSQPVFILKDSPPELVAATNVQPKGRKYDNFYSEQPGAVRIDEVVAGMKYASLAITDDKEGTLKKVGKANPWHKEALKIITGSKEEAHKPLTTILSEHMGLTCDKIIDVTGITPGGHFLDTQGYIAHNDEVIVLAYRCTTSAFDWLTNFNTTSSEWEIEEDLAQGFSGYCSGLEGLCCWNAEHKPRVHTGFYNNFLASLPFIRTYIEPLLKDPDQPPRKLYVVGHSLGAGIATMAACYFLLEHDWTESPHKLVCITAGSPRAVQKSMKEQLDQEINKLRPLDKAVICRIVRDKDIVPTLPPSLFGFRHLEKLAYITDDGELLVNPALDDDHVINKKEMVNLMESVPALTSTVFEDEDDEKEEEGTVKSKYDKFVAVIPRRFRDHMPDFYLKPLIKLFEKEHNVNLSKSNNENVELNRNANTLVKTEDTDSSVSDKEPVEETRDQEPIEDKREMDSIEGKRSRSLSNITRKLSSSVRLFKKKKKKKQREQIDDAHVEV